MTEQIVSTSEEKQDAELQMQLWPDVTLSCGGASRSEADPDRDDQISNACSGYLRDQEPPGMLGHPQAHGQTDDQIQDQQEQVGQPPVRNRKKNHEQHPADHFFMRLHACSSPGERPPNICFTVSR